MNVAEINMPFYEQVLDFLARGPSVREIIQYRPAPDAQKRFSELLSINRDRKLTLVEEEELDHYIRIERMLSLLKAKAYRQANLSVI